MGASHIGNHEEMNEMLALAATAGIKSWIQTVPISAEGCKKAVEAVEKGGVRYRYVLTGVDKHFERS
jgi:alcohol dehydrogenase (NADP+)